MSTTDPNAVPLPTPVGSSSVAMVNGTNNTVAASAMHLFAPDPNAGSESVSFGMPGGVDTLNS